jgi:hypothetical protein
MAKKRLNKSISTYTNDPISRRVDQVRRDDDTVKTPKITIEDIDFAMMSYIRDVIQPRIIENEVQVEVPVMYANGETFAQIQARGFMRDAKGKIMTPLISITRSSIAERDPRTLGVNQNPDGNGFVYRTKYNNINKYDRFSLQQNKTPVQEYYVVPVPEFLDVSYEILLWTTYTTQLNSLIEQIMPLNGFAWGTTFKFPVYISDYSFETTNTGTDDRIVRARIPFVAKGTLLMPYELRASNLQKQFSMKKIKFTNERQTDNFNTAVDNPPPGGYRSTDGYTQL